MSNIIDHCVAFEINRPKSTFKAKLENKCNNIFKQVKNHDTNQINFLIATLSKLYITVTKIAIKV